ncbi:MAG: XRE family transcriptional regulator [Frankiaceae bacterium]
MSDEDAVPKPSLAEQLDRLFRLVRPVGEAREYSYKEVAGGVTARGAPATSENYIYLLRVGRRDNPGKKLLEALADFFGVDVSYFYSSSSTSQKADAELELIAALRDSSIRQLALRSVDLSKGNLRHLIGIVEQIRGLEGLPSEARPPVETWSSDPPEEEAEAHRDAKDDQADPG